VRREECLLIMVLLKTIPVFFNGSCSAPGGGLVFREIDQVGNDGDVAITDKGQATLRRHSQHYEATCLASEVDGQFQRGISETIAIRLSLVPHYRSLNGYYVETSETLFRGRTRAGNGDLWNDRQCIVGLWEEGKRMITDERESKQYGMSYFSSEKEHLAKRGNCSNRAQGFQNHKIISGLGKHFEDIYSSTETDCKDTLDEHKLNFERLPSGNEIIKENASSYKCDEVSLNGKNAKFNTDEESVPEEESAAFPSIVASFISSYLLFGFTLFTKSKDCVENSQSTN